MNRVMVIVLAGMMLAAQARAELRVAMILPGSDTDKGWNQMAREGLDRIARELKARTRVVTNVKSSEFYNQISNFAEDGYNVIICHGGEFEKPAAQAAKTYPKTKIIVGGCPVDVPGAVAVEFLTRDASELVGFVAGKVSRTRKAAFVGAMKVGPLEACYDGMAAGLKLAGTGVEPLPALWTNSWDSPILARESAETAMASGADVIYQNVDAAAIGVFQAVQAASRSGKTVYAFGCNSNQNAVAPDVILGSVVLDIGRAYFELTREAGVGKLPAGPRKLGLAGGYVDLVLNDKNRAVTDDLRKAVEQARQKLLAAEKREANAEK